MNPREPRAALGRAKQRVVRLTGLGRLRALRDRVEECRVALAENDRLARDLERQVTALEQSLVPLLEDRAGRRPA